MTRLGVLAVVLSVLMGCATSPQADFSSQYDQKFIYPRETDNFVLVQKRVYDEPMLGVGLKYQDKGYAQDIIDLYVYPIALLEWQDMLAVLVLEAKHALDDIDAGVEQGYYQARRGEHMEIITIKAEGKKFRGVKLETEVVDKVGRRLASFIYLFSDEDKYIKFRVSMLKSGMKLPIPDYVPHELLPKIKVPPESEFMAALRKQKLMEMQQQ